MAAETCVVIPAYRAEAAIESVVKATLEQGLHVIVVDDASGDDTGAMAKKAGAAVIHRAVNGGKGAALREGLQAALQEGFRWILTMDADGQHLPAEIPRFIQIAAEGKVDVILGSRMWNPRGMPFERRLTNWFMSWLLSRITGQRIPDSQCGFRLISHRALKNLDLTSDRFEIESELVIKSSWAGFTLTSIPVSSVYEKHSSFIHPLRDTVRFLLFLRSLRQLRQR